MKNFIAIDGEAIENRYVLLGTSHSSYCLEDKQGIKTDDALHFLFSLGHNRHNRKNQTSYVGYFFGYDVEMICRDLPVKIKRRLFNPQPILRATGERKGAFRKDRIFYKEWELTYIKKKFFSIKRKGANHGITIYDVSGFFTGFPERSFISVLKQLGITVPDEVIAGKQMRQFFSWDNYQTIKRYNQIECEKLVELMQKIYTMCQAQDLVPRRWYGSSAVGNLALRKWGIKDYMRRTVPENLSPYFWDAITSAYFGGRIEAFKLGAFNETIHAYDINSAYPFAITFLPSTRENHFIYRQKYVKGFGVWHVRFKFPRKIDIGVLPFRLKDGSIKFPLSGEGWYWSPEIELCQKHYPECIEILEGYAIEDPKKETPLKKLFPYLYEARKKFKRSGDLQHYIIKIVLNSIYGKFAQKVGRADFKNFSWAGYITSYTRAKLREAIIDNEQDIIALATDGIYSLKPLKLKLSDKLGGWDYSFYERGCVLMSGVYLLESGDKTKTGKRGYASLSDWQFILDQLNDSKKAEVIVRLFVGFNMVDNFPEEYRNSYLKFVERVKLLNPYQLSKRKYLTKQIKNWNNDYCDSEPIGHLSGISQPIKTKFEFRDEDDLVFTETGEEIIWTLKE